MKIKYIAILLIITVNLFSLESEETINLDKIRNIIKNYNITVFENISIENEDFNEIIREIEITDTIYYNKYFSNAIELYNKIKEKINLEKENSTDIDKLIYEIDKRIVLTKFNDYIFKINNLLIKDLTVDISLSLDNYYQCNELYIEYKNIVQELNNQKDIMQKYNFKIENIIPNLIDEIQLIIATIKNQIINSFSIKIDDFKNKLENFNIENDKDKAIYELGKFYNYLQSSILIEMDESQEAKETFEYYSNKFDYYIKKSPDTYISDLKNIEEEINQVFDNENQLDLDKNIKIDNPIINKESKNEINIDEIKKIGQIKIIIKDDARLFINDEDKGYISSSYQTSLPYGKYKIKTVYKDNVELEQELIINTNETYNIYFGYQSLNKKIKNDVKKQSNSLKNAGIVLNVISDIILLSGAGLLASSFILNEYIDANEKNYQKYYNNKILSQSFFYAGIGTLGLGTIGFSFSIPLMIYKKKKG